MSEPLTTTPVQSADPRLQPPPDADLAPNPLPDSCLLVGIGASAGGVQALRKFFSNVRADSGLAYLVVLHLSPDHDSHLTQILQDTCEIPVVLLDSDTPIHPNQVYVVPPHHRVYLMNGWLRPARIQQDRGQIIPIDLCLRSLAEAHGYHSACVILSGTGSDGTQGLKRMKEMGGLTFVQDPDDAEYPEMPRSAIGSRKVDCVTPAAEIPSQLLAQWRIGAQLRISHSEEAALAAAEEAAAAPIRDLLALVRARTGNDFSQYKRATILRRIERRMQVNQFRTIHEYLTFIRRNSSEVHALLRDFMISVTEFFRDPRAFRALERRVIPRLFKEVAEQKQIRVWVPACATGEEAYSLAILFHEQAALRQVSPRVQVFATDIDAHAIEVARKGEYEETIAADLTPERLRRFFIKEGKRYRVRKEVRESVLFATQNVLTDPPFSRIDLISCRNLLIYLNQEMQERLLELLHFALRPEGYLFLGASESAEEGMGLFAPLDKRERIFTRRPGNQSALTMRRIRGVVPNWAPRAAGPPPASDDAARPLSLADLRLQLLEQCLPANVLVNENHEILHVGREGGRYLRFPVGEPSNNLLRVVHPELRIELRTALYSAHQKHAVEVRHLKLEENQQTVVVKLTVRPVEAPDSVRGYSLVLFEEVPAQTSAPQRRGVSDEPLAKQLEEELQGVRTEMRDVVERYEIGNEELHAANEELQAINEELRSATEELETSKEELEALNEELMTVNLELKSNLEELSRANSDLQNLMASTDIGTIFLNRSLQIKRYTLAAGRIFNLIPTDIGRPLSDLSHHLDYPQLTDDARQVLTCLTPVDREARCTDSNQFLVRITPYRTLDDRIDGVVVTFLDITELKRTTEALAASEERFRLLVEGAQAYAMFLLDPDRHVIFWSAGAERVLGYSRDEVIGKSADLIFTPEDCAAGVPTQEAEIAGRHGYAPDRRWHLRNNGERFWTDGIMTALRTPEGEIRGFAKVFRDATEEKKAQDQLAAAHEQLEARVGERTAELQRAHMERRRLGQQLISAEEAERRRIARELHDQTGQQLAALILELRHLGDALQNQSPAEATLERARTLADRVSQEVHSLAFELRPTSLDDLGLARALENYLIDWSSRTGIQAEFHETGVSEKRVPPEVETALYRIVQEALHNVTRHAGPATVSVILDRRSNDVQAIVEDTGTGFDAEDVLQRLGGSHHLGIGGMMERASLLGGEVALESTPGHGTTVFARIPLGKPKRRSLRHALGL